MACIGRGDGEVEQHYYRDRRGQRRRGGRGEARCGTARHGGGQQDQQRERQRRRRRRRQRWRHSSSSSEARDGGLGPARGGGPRQRRKRERTRTRRRARPPTNQANTRHRTGFFAHQRQGIRRAGRRNMVGEGNSAAAGQGRGDASPGHRAQRRARIGSVVRELLGRRGCRLRARAMRRGEKVSGGQECVVGAGQQIFLSAGAQHFFFFFSGGGGGN